MTAPYFGVKTGTYSTFQRYPQVAPYSGLFFCKNMFFYIFWHDSCLFTYVFSVFYMFFQKSIYFS